ncbi:HugZ family pyridoxamine 5'-phosphate oxidase [Aureimonas psammosilenae]|uniref:HugZ family pyridoxamine 5'-phosphate oxidase n=1 Tax=Aureimonas psammosilenae TaxID=2495496 RepID=UPI0012610DA2|nr:DUF2470 domain-containing protein [Aureimonas psammosilenae]
MSRTESQVLRPLDDDARRLARRLVRAARHAALASLLPENQGPHASRVLVASDELGRPVLLVSMLAVHAGALLADPRCSILFGELGAGDPLAHPRLSLSGRAFPLEGEDRETARARFLARHPSAEFYCDFADFRFLRVEPTHGSLNAGFARAYELGAADLLDEDCETAFTLRLKRAADHMNDDHADAVDAIALRHGKAEGTGWRIVTTDASGFEIAKDDELRRVFFTAPIRHADEIRDAFVTLAKSSA